MKLSLTQEEIEKIVLAYVNTNVPEKWAFNEVKIISSYSYSEPFCMVSKSGDKEAA